MLSFFPGGRLHAVPNDMGQESRSSSCRLAVRSPGLQRSCGSAKTLVGAALQSNFSLGPVPLASLPLCAPPPAHFLSTKVQPRAASISVVCMTLGDPGSSVTKGRRGSDHWWVTAIFASLWRYHGRGHVGMSSVSSHGEGGDEAGPHDAGGHSHASVEC